MKKNKYGGLFVAFDGPNGAGKSTLIAQVQHELVSSGFDVCVTKEPSDTPLGHFTQKMAESLDGECLTCLVAADRYSHLKQTIIPELKKEKIVITDRYILSSLILQSMDNVEEDFILAANDRVILPDIQIAVRANAAVIQSRLNERNNLTRFEREKRPVDELYFMGKGEVTLNKMGIPILEIDNSGNLQKNVALITKCILEVRNEMLNA